jgi:hypothetical protein
VCGVCTGFHYLNRRQQRLTSALLDHSRTIAQQEALLEKVENTCSHFARYVRTPSGLNGALKLLQGLAKRAGLEGLRSTTLPATCVVQAGSWSIWRLPVRLSFMTESDRAFWDFLDALVRSPAGFVEADFLSIERVRLSNGRIAIKGRYHFSWFVFSRGPVQSRRSVQSRGPVQSMGHSPSRAQAQAKNIAPGPDKATGFFSGAMFSGALRGMQSK